MPFERKKFGDIFEESSDRTTLTLKVRIKVGDKEFDKGISFGQSGLDGINFHQFRYLDVGVEEQNGTLEIKGFYGQD